MSDILRVGTDCSGIEAPIEALKQLKIPFKHIFSSEIDKFCIQSIKANYKPEIIFGDKEGPYPEGDITKRKIEDVPDIDLYVCGFPCQPFSTAGVRKGFEDKRGNVFFSCLELIEKKQPKYFILENVKGLKSHDKGNTWKVIWNELLKLEKYDYYIDWKILNTKDYGIPQNRERIFIVGCKGKKFEWPKKIKMKLLNGFIDFSDSERKTIPKCSKHLLDIIPNESVFIDIGRRYNTFQRSDIYCPTITCSTTLWNVILSRYANIKEKLMLQGFKNINKKVSNTQLHKQIGNSISVNVLKCIYKKLFNI
jgi:DNA (cytosine-5)-methyltransferase 1